MLFGPLIGIVDEGSASKGFVIYKAGTDEIVCFHQLHIPHISPQEGFVEVDPMLMLVTILECIERALEKLIKLGGNNSDIIAVGVTNQRESLVMWDKEHGLPLYNAIIWLDSRSASTVEKLLDKVPNNKRDKNYLKSRCGLPLSSYFCAPKICWLMDNVQSVEKAIAKGTCLCGTSDSWLIWNLTGGATNGGLHITDVTNASRTMLMNIKTLQWDDFLLKFFQIPKKILPEIRSSSEIYGTISLKSLHCPIASCLGDMQATMVGYQIYNRGQAKCSYNYSCSLLCNIGNSIIISKRGLLTTVAYQFGKKSKPVYALEGYVAMAEAATEWLQKNIGITTSSVCEADARSVADCGDVYFVPAFNGLYTPYWDCSARGIIVGLNNLTKKEHIVRAAIEATCFQIQDILAAMKKDSGCSIEKLLVDGSMIKNKLLLQLQSDFSNIEIVEPRRCEMMTSLGASIAAYRAIMETDILLDIPEDSYEIYRPQLTSESNVRYARWKEAVERSLGWETTTD